MTGQDRTGAGPGHPLGGAPPALLVGVVAWFVLGVLELVVAAGTWPGREPDPGIESLRNQMGSDVVSTGGSGWPNLAGLVLGAGLLAGAVLLLLGRRWARPALPAAGILVIIALGTAGRVEVAIGLGLFVVATVATMTVGVHRHLAGREMP